MIELVKAELSYKKWDYAAALAIGLSIGVLYLLMSVVVGGEGLLRAMPAFFVITAAMALIFAGMLLPREIYKTISEENRTSQLALLPIPLSRIAMSMTVPYLLFCGALTVLGCVAGLALPLTAAELAGGSLIDDFWALYFNLAVFSAAMGLVGFLCFELGAQAPKWLSHGFQALAIVVMVALTQVDGFYATILSRETLTSPWPALVSVPAGVAGFFGHVLLFTRGRGDFSAHGHKG